MWLVWIMVRTGFRLPPTSYENRRLNQQANKEFRLNYRKPRKVVF
jgi:hypothetical protein